MSMYSNFCFHLVFSDVFDHMYYCYDTHKYIRLGILPNPDTGKLMNKLPPRLLQNMFFRSIHKLITLTFVLNCVN